MTQASFIGVNAGFQLGHLGARKREKLESGDGFRHRENHRRDEGNHGEDHEEFDQGKSSPGAEQIGMLRLGEWGYVFGPT